MNKTLNEVYLEKKVKLILEKFDAQKLQKISKNIAVLEKTIQPFKAKLKNLTLALNNAKSKAAEMAIGKGGPTGFFSKLASNIGLVNELKDFVVFQTSMMEGFKSFPLIVSVLQKADIDLDSEMSLKDLLSGKDEKNPLSRQNIDEIVKTFVEAMLPTKWFGGSEKRVPFVRNINDVARDFINLSPKEIFDLAERASEFENSEVDMQFIKSLYQASKNVVPTPEGEKPKDVPAGVEDKIKDILGTPPAPPAPGGKKSLKDVLQSMGLDTNDPDVKQAMPLLVKFYNEIK